MGARDPVARQQAGFGRQFGQIFRNREDIPDAGAVMVEPRHQHGRRHQQQFRAVVRIVERHHLFLDLQTGNLT